MKNNLLHALRYGMGFCSTTVGCGFGHLPMQSIDTETNFLQRLKIRIRIRDVFHDRYCKSSYSIVQYRVLRIATDGRHIN
jgi:hypothetical protein